MGVVKNLYREKRIVSGNFVEIEITPAFMTKRGKKINVEDKEFLEGKEITDEDREKIKKKNKKAYEKRRKKEFIRIAHCNFTENDYVVHFTYSDNHRPGTLEEAEKEARNYIRRLNYKRKKKGLDEIKYMLVTEYGQEDTGLQHVHHHMILNGGLTRDEVEDTWSKRKKSIGYVNARRLQFSSENGLSDLCNYMLKKPEGKRKWTGSKNLKKPIVKSNYYKWSRRKVKNVIRDGIDNKAEWENLYKNLQFKNATHVYNDWLGDLLYIQFVKKE